MDDNDFIGRDRPRFSNPYGVLSWIYERFTTCCAKNVWTICDLLRSTRCRRKPRLCRPGKQDRLRVRDEPNGAISFAEREVVAIGRRDLRSSVAAFGPPLQSFSDHGAKDFPPVRSAAVFEKENALPRSELHSSVHNGHRLASARQDHSDV